MLAFTLSLVLTAAPSDTGAPHWSPNATKRHAGALIGAVVGAALPLLTLPVINSGCTLSFVCPSDLNAIALVASTMLGSVGLTLGHALGDGSEPSFGAAALGALVGSVVSLGWLGLMGRTVEVQTREGAALLMVSTLPITIALQLLALEVRHGALELHPERSVPWRRFGAAVGAGALTLLGGTLLGLVLGLVSVPTFPTVLLPVGIGLSLPLAPLAVTAAHRALGGRGGFGAAYLGMLAALVAAAPIILIANFASSGSFITSVNVSATLQATSGFGVTALTVAALASSAIAVELSHARQEENEPAAPEVSFDLRFAPMPNGGAAVLSGRW